MNALQEHEWPDRWRHEQMPPDQYSPDDAKRLREYHFLWSTLREWPDEQPSPQVSLRFYRLLQEETQAQRLWEHPQRPLWSRIKQQITHIFSPRMAWQLGFGVVCICTGLLIGRVAFSPANTKGDFEQLRRDVYALQDQMAASMLQQASASDRLAGIDRIRTINIPEPTATSVLLRLLNNDPNVNVRLSAADALMYYVQGNPALIKQVEESFSKQPSPIVQSVLIEMLAQSKEKSSVRMLEEVQDQTSEPILREQISQRLQTLKAPQQP
ncbi:MAG: HEAT repeat domain-containing protein [Bacteroidetes Order II. Incertae sedis bacterium]|nr:HEAT repeat domain-containing protein [Bacteroidetes Order II. bacterium]